MIISYLNYQLKNYINYGVNYNLYLFEININLPENF